MSTSAVHLMIRLMYVLQDALPLTEVEAAFDTSVRSIGDRDCRIQRVSALKGWVSPVEFPGKSLDTV